MKDILGNELALGDTVVFGKAQTMCLHKGKVIKINAKTVIIEHEEYSNGSYSRIAESRRNFEDVVKVNI